MDIENIRIILKVAECASINRASLFSYKTQSQVSRIIKMFEDSLNVIIFERSTKGIKVTDEGERILKYCQNIVDLYDEMAENHQKSSPEYHGIVNIYTTLNIYSTISKVIGGFSALFPSLFIHQQTCDLSQAIEAVSQDNNAIGLISQLSTEQHIFKEISKDMCYNEICRVPIVALCSVKSSFFRKYKTLSAKSIAQLPLIDFNPYSSDMSFTKQILTEISAEYTFRYSTDDFRVLQSLLTESTGVYVGILPSTKLLTDDIVNIPIKSSLKIIFGSLISQNASEAVQYFNRYLLEQYHKLY